jgi:hypothetical protein
MRCASITSLLEIKDVTDEMAKTIRAIWKAESKQALSEAYVDLYEVEKAFHSPLKLTPLKRHCIDQLLGTCGVEHLGYDTRANRHVYYCNAGDTYATTICFVGESLTVTCWGYYVERGTIEEKVSY